MTSKIKKRIPKIIKILNHGGWGGGLPQYTYIINFIPHLLILTSIVYIVPKSWEGGNYMIIHSFLCQFKKKIFAPAKKVGGGGSPGNTPPMLHACTVLVKLPNWWRISLYFKVQDFYLTNVNDSESSNHMHPIGFVKFCIFSIVFSFLLVMVYCSIKQYSVFNYWAYQLKKLECYN